MIFRLRLRLNHCDYVELHLLLAPVKNEINQNQDDRKWWNFDRRLQNQDGLNVLILIYPDFGSVELATAVVNDILGSCL